MPHRDRRRLDQPGQRVDRAGEPLALGVEAGDLLLAVGGIEQPEQRRALAERPAAAGLPRTISTRRAAGRAQRAREAARRCAAVPATSRRERLGILRARARRRDRRAGAARWSRPNQSAIRSCARSTPVGGHQHRQRRRARQHRAQAAPVRQSTPCAACARRHPSVTATTAPASQAARISPAKAARSGSSDDHARSGPAASRFIATCLGKRRRSGSGQARGFRSLLAGMFESRETPGCSGPSPTPSLRSSASERRLERYAVRSTAHSSAKLAREEADPKRGHVVSEGRKMREVAGARPRPPFIPKAKSVAVMIRLERAFGSARRYSRPASASAWSASRRASRGAAPRPSRRDAWAGHRPRSSYFSALGEQLDLRERLVGEARRHHEARVAGGAAEVHQAALGEDDDLLAVGELDQIGAAA